MSKAYSKLGTRVYRPATNRRVTHCEANVTGGKHRIVWEGDVPVCTKCNWRAEGEYRYQKKEELIRHLGLEEEDRERWWGF